MTHCNRTTRRGVIETLLAASTGSALYGSLDSEAWKEYESVEKDWIRDRFNLLIHRFPSVSGAAQLDMELRLAELQRRAMHFQHLLNTHPRSLRGGIWQLSWLPLSGKDAAAIAARDAGYLRHDRYLRGLTEALRQHPDYEALKQAQTRLWKTPEYKEIHRRYADLMQDLQDLYGSGTLTQ